jgi:hypothetical protein
MTKNVAGILKILQKFEKMKQDSIISERKLKKYRRNSTVLKID